MNNYKIIFIGTPDFAVPSLNKLIEANYNIITIITQPDKKVGRKQEVVYSPVKKVALKHNISLLQPQNIKEIAEEIKNLNPDIIITAAYGQIIPKSILDIPVFGCINIHGSLLPKYRGASPIQYAILNGDEKTGVTIMKMNEKMDEGQIISKQELTIKDTDTASSLHDKLSIMGSKLLTETLPKIFRKEIEYAPQDHAKATYTKILKKENGQIDWNKSAQKINRMIRAFYPWPGTYTHLNNKRLRIIKADIIKNKDNKIPGTIFTDNDNNLLIKCQEDALIINRIQLEGKKVTAGREFLKGHANILNKVLK